MRKLRGITVVIFISLLFATFSWAEEAPQKVVDLAYKTLAKYGTDPVIVRAVKAQNAMGKSLGDIKAMDEKWRKTPGIADFMEKLMVSDCGKHLTEIMESEEYYSEIFVMDDKGANVAMSDKTSDYWQGDEKKFIRSYAEGKGSVFVDAVEFDDSTQAYLVQVSVPVTEGGKAIGAITFGINVDKIE